MRTAWRERTEREGWDVRYTVIGGRFSNDPLDREDTSASELETRAVSQAMVAATASDSVASDEVRFWSSVVRKIVQRGSRPVILHTDASVLDAQVRDESRIRAAVAGPVDAVWELDASIELHPVYEVPFWDFISSDAPHLRRWLAPQVWLEGLLGATAGSSERWVDFLLHLPWIPKPAVIEIDGSGHDEAVGADRARDSVLRNVGIQTRRVRGADLADNSNATLRRLATGFHPTWLGTPDPDLVTAIHGPASIHRFVYALAEGVERGFLVPNQMWNIALSDDVGAVLERPNIALDLVAAIADAWDLDIVPKQIALNGQIWEQSLDGRYQRSEESTSQAPDLHIDLAAFTPPHAALPQTGRPAIVIRGCLLPVDLAWTKTTSVERRNRIATDRSRAALSRILRDLYGHDEFQEGQGEAVSRILSGGDACVLLPTGGGKTLIYQMAGMLRPGVTLVVAPLKALIDDQERRFRELGVDRVVGLHSGRGLDSKERTQIQRAIGGGEACVVLVSPERLQIEGFRIQVGEAASHHLVNLAVIDEAHCVSEWGHQFRTSYLRLGRNLRRVCANLNDEPPPLLALTATASPRVLNDMMSELGLDADDPGLLHRPSSFDRPNLHYRVFPTEPRQRTEAVTAAIGWVAEEMGETPQSLSRPQGDNTAAGIVFVPHVKSGMQLGLFTYTEVVAKAMDLDASEGIAQFAGRPPDDRPSAEWERQKVEYADDFLRNKRSVMVSTNAFGMGIDKPNIRFTVNVVLPSSIESFAQESGRAGRGRDKGDSYCALVAPKNPRQEAAKIGSRSSFDTNFARDDVGIQLGFLKGSFPDPDQEHTVAISIAAELLATAAPGGTAIISRSVFRPRHDGQERPEKVDPHAKEKALFRLLLVGLIDDYTIEYGSDTFTVHLEPFDEASIRSATSKFLDRASGGNRRLQDEVEAVPSGPILEVLSAMLRLLVDAVFERVEPARALALREMLLLSDLADQSDSIRERINAYLSEGPVASLLDKLVRNEANLEATLQALTMTPPDELEWAGAATRYLESYPDHPVLRIVRTLGEAWKRDGSRSDFSNLAHEFAQSLGTFPLDPADVERLITWALDLVRNYFNGTRRTWALDIWAALESEHVPEAVMIAAEDVVLDSASTGIVDHLELEHVLKRRTRRSIAAGARIVEHYTIGT